MTLGIAPELHPTIAALDEATVAYFLGLPSWERLTGTQSGGSMGIVEQEIFAGFQSPYHVHHREDELWYVLDGDVRFVSGSTSIVVPKGGIAFLPRDIAHGFEVMGRTPARMLCVTTPAGFEGFIAANSEPQPPQAGPDMARLLSTAQQFGLEILGALPEPA
ncbi:MAG: cupin domain-containing protein [Chloroflexota bacterium]